MGTPRLARAGAVVCLVLAVGLTLLTGRTAWVGLAPNAATARLTDQLAWLQPQVDGEAPHAMQELFPEGAFFTIVLTGLASAGDEGQSEQARLEQVRARLAQLEDPRVASPFEGTAGLDRGAFFHGWRLLLMVEHARLATGEESAAARQAVRTEATAVVEALQTSPTGFLESYPGMTWPVDNVVLVAALSRADALADVPGADAAIAAWLVRAEALAEPHGGLLPHRIDAGGNRLQGPRGSSQSLIQVFWPDIDPEGAPSRWSAFRDAFVVRRVGLVGVLEYPRGARGEADVDSGPLVVGVSASASAVTLAAARRQGAIVLADSLDREAELLGLPFEWGGQRRYAAGVIPVGDAFLAWARSVPASSGTAAADGPTPVWAVIVGLPLSGAVACGVLGVWLWRRR